MVNQQIGPVVIADTHPLERLGIAALLKRALFCETFEIASDFQSLSRLVNKATGLVVLDLNLPGLTSHALIRKLRMASSLTKIVVVSGPCRAETVLSLLGSGAHGIIPKALSQNDFIDALRSIAKGQIYVPRDLSETALQVAVGQSNHEAQSTKELSDRQRQVLSLASRGRSNKEIARVLQIAEATVKVHMGAAFRVMGVKNRAGALAALNGDKEQQAQSPTPLQTN